MPFTKYVTPMRLPRIVLKAPLTAKPLLTFKTLCSTGTGAKPSDRSTSPARGNEKPSLSPDEWRELWHGYEQWLDGEL